MTTEVYPASAKQVGFLSNLGWRQDVYSANHGPLSGRDASWLISLALETGMDAPRTVSPEPVTSTGMYRHGENIYKVQANRENGRLYAKRLVPIRGVRLAEDGEVVSWQFEYAPGALRILRSSNRMSLEEAREFGVRFGVCCVCGKTLTDANSVAAGIGPICSRNV